VGCTGAKDRERSGNRVATFGGEALDDCRLEIAIAGDGGGG
jgi:hypothetical protein